MFKKYECVIGDPQMLIQDSQTEFSVSQMAFFFSQMENDIFTNTHIFVIFSHQNKDNALFKASTLKQFDIVLFYEGVGVQLQRES